jgi:phage shock protein PspC (stress-responsive transcriptional regulator)
MKKTININLGGQPFIIDEQAYHMLHSYFEALKLKFTNEAEQKEILSDIEARVAEVFAQRLAKTRAVVSEEDVEHIISLMGRPEDIAGEPDAASAGQQAKSAAASASYTGPVEKKFFRDPDNKKVGGVISGLCHYFGWSDPTWIRVAVIILSLFSGFSLGFPIAVIYLILLIVVPEATTSAEKLQMRGEPVTIQNIEKEVRDAMTTAGHSIHSMVKGNNVWSRIVDVFVTIVKVFARVVSVILLLACAAVMLFFLLSMFGYAVISGITLSELAHLLVANESLLILLYITVILFIFLPLIAIMYDVIRFLAGSKAQNPAFKRALWILWGATWLSLFIMVPLMVKNFNSAETQNIKVPITALSAGTLHIQLTDATGKALPAGKDHEEDDDLSDLMHVSPAKTENGYAFNHIKLEINVSPDSSFHVEKIFYSRGANSADALRNIDGIKYSLSQKDTLLDLDNKFEIPRRAKWRMQSVKIRIYVPEGHKVSLAENIDDLSISVKNKDRKYDDDILAGKTLIVRNGKVTCDECRETDEDEPDDKRGRRHN